LQVLTDLVITERTGFEGAIRRTNSICKCWILWHILFYAFSI